MSAAEIRRPPLPDTSIDPAKLYRADEIAARMGWRPSGWRAARRAGLKALRYGKRFFVKGADLIAFVEEQAAGD
jgi:hypothetical protein